MSGANQLSLFDAAPDSAGAWQAPAVAPAAVQEAHAELASRLPAWLRFGTSSFTFTGWGRGLVYEGAPTQAALVETGLGAYAVHPLLRTVSFDRGYYAPLARADLDHYAAQLPAGFSCVSKVWEEISTCVFPSHAKYGARAGQANPGFLDPARFESEVLTAYAGFGAHQGPFVIEVAPIPSAALPHPTVFAERVDAFLSQVPRHDYAFELRNAALLSRDYLRVLKKHGAAHVFNYWTGMPAIAEQLAVPDVLTADFVVARLMLPPFARYEELKASYAPFDKFVAKRADMRQDIMVLLKLAKAKSVRGAWVLVNNKAEGCAPRTCFDLAERAAREL